MAPPKQQAALVNATGAPIHVDGLPLLDRDPVFVAAEWLDDPAVVQLIEMECVVVESRTPGKDAVVHPAPDRLADHSADTSPDPNGDADDSADPATTDPEA